MAIQWGRGLSAIGQALAQQALRMDERQQREAMLAKEEARYQAEQARENERWGQQVKFREQDRADRLAETDFNRQTTGWLKVDPVKDAAEGVQATLASARATMDPASLVPGHASQAGIIGQALARNMPTAQAGDAAYRYTPSADPRMIATRMEREQRGQDSAADFTRRKELIALEDKLARERQASAPQSAVNLVPLPTAGGFVAFNPRTGQAEPIQAGGQLAMPRPTGTQANSSKDRDEALKQIQTMRQFVANPSPVGDIALGYSFMKAQDPGSVVRGEEFDLLSGTGGWGARLEARARQNSTGERFTPQQRADMLRQAEAAFVAKYGPIPEQAGPTREAAAVQGLGAAEGALSENEIRAARDAVASKPLMQRQKALREAGYSADEIKLILGGR